MKLSEKLDEYKTKHTVTDFKWFLKWIYLNLNVKVVDLTPKFINEDHTSGGPCRMAIDVFMIVVAQGWEEIIDIDIHIYFL